MINKEVSIEFFKSYYLGTVKTNISNYHLIMAYSLPMCFTTAITLLLFQAVVFSAPQPLQQKRQVEEDVPLGLRIETGLIRLKDLIIFLFPYSTEPNHQVSTDSTCTVH